MFKIVVAMFTTMILLCSMVSVSALSLRQEGVTESIHTRPTMNWLEMATQMVVPSPPTLPIFEPIKAMDTVVSGPGSVTTGYVVGNILYASSDTQCTGQSFTSATLFALGICIVLSGSTGGMYTSDVRCVYSFHFAGIILQLTSLLCVFCFIS